LESVTNIEDEIRSRVDAFVAELSDLVRRAALEAVANALTGQLGTPRKPGRAKRAPQARRAEHLPEAARAPRRRGEKRPPEEISALTERALECIRSNTGQGVEQIAKSLGTTTRELTLPMKRLLAEKKITSKGEKRATRYFIR
jgi:transcriptional regulator with GAF, ATPase, and Fis domain